LKTEQSQSVLKELSTPEGIKKFLVETKARINDDLDLQKHAATTGPNRYYKETVFYKSPTVKEAKATLPSDRIDIPNSYITKKMKWRSDEEIRSIWSKPLVDFEITLTDKIALAFNGDVTKQRAVLLDSPHSPCRGIWRNMAMDKCFMKDRPEKLTRDDVMADFNCKDKLFDLIQCTNKHKTWYEARQATIRKFLGIQDEDVHVTTTRKLSSYPKYDIPKSI